MTYDTLVLNLGKNYFAWLSSPYIDFWLSLSCVYNILLLYAFLQQICIYISSF